MYIEKYINDFDEDMYKYYLSDYKKLEQLADAYASQYSNPTYDCTIAFKESLDHYIAREYSKNPSITKEKYFRNYLHYLNYIFGKRVGKGNSQLEYNTNIVFQNEKLKNVIFTSIYDSNTRNKLNSIIDRNSSFIDKTLEKLDNNDKITQTEIDILADYLYTKRDLNDPRYPKFIEYLINSKNKDLKPSPEIMAAYIAYIPKIYGDGVEYSRVILSNGIAVSSDIKTILPEEINQYKGMKKLRYLKLYSHGDSFVSIDWNYLKNLDLYSTKSLDIARTTNEENRDLYWISMVCFHEMTHQLQTNAMRSQEINNSGFAMLIKYVRNKDTDNTINHDSIESEIEADEVAWDKMWHFIFKYKKGDINIRGELLRKCTINKDTTYARRAIRTKYNCDGSVLASDIKEIKALIDNPTPERDYKSFFNKCRNYFPMLDKIFDKDGQVKSTILFENNLTSKNETGNDENIMACELANYILNNKEKYIALRNHLLNDPLSKTQISNLLRNVYNTYHLEKKFLRSLSKLDLSQLEETRTNIDYRNKEVLQEKYLEKFKNIASLVYKEREMTYIIKRKYPEYQIEKHWDPRYGLWNYKDAFDYLYKICDGNIEYDMIANIIEKYEKTGDPILTELARSTRESIPSNPKKI